MKNIYLNNQQLVENMAFLYELVLAIGQSLDLEKNCDIFFKKLLEHKELSYTQLWLSNKFLQKNRLIATEKESGLHLFYTAPEFFANKREDDDDSLLKLLNKQDYLVITENNHFFKKVADENIEQGQYILFPLNNFGVLKLYSKESNQVIFSIAEYKQLLKILDKFSRVITSCLKYNKLKFKVKEVKEDQEYYDNLTKLPNRILFTKEVKKYIKSMSQGKNSFNKLATLVISIDKLNLINNLFSYEKGDKLLKDIADSLLKFSKENNYSRLARLGGNDFALSFAIEDEAEIVNKIEGVIKKLNKPFIINNQEVTINCYVGISVYPNDINQNQTNLGDILLKKAETAMQKGKSDYNYNNKYKFYNDKMAERSIKKIALENDLKKAIARDELITYYQPQIDVNSGKIIGVEALLRWKRGGKIVPPNEFIPVAEKTGLIIPIGQWVLYDSCKQIIKWQQQGLPFLQLGVNISTVQFQESNLFAKIKDILLGLDFPPEKLKLEITENVLMKNLKKANQILYQLKELGVKISIDDFGTGFSSLSYLGNLPINELKIDKSFIFNLENEKENRVITETIISLAKNLETNVIAEGVEKIEHLNFLKNRDCDQAQGYLISKPMRPDKISAILQKGSNFSHLENYYQQSDRSF